MKSAYLKNIIRTFNRSKGRFFAILAIVMLGVGFFAGLKVTKETMVGTADRFYREHRFYDYRLISTYGFTDTEIEKLEKRLECLFASGEAGKKECEGVEDSPVLLEGSFYEDFIYVDLKGDSDILRAYSIPEKVNTLALREGRMPEKPDECLLDADKFGSKYLGELITIDASNDSTAIDSFKYKEYKVVGLVNSPLYLSGERETTSIGNGRVTAAVFIPKEGMSFEYYKEAYLSCQDSMKIYTDEYDELIDSYTDSIRDILGEMAYERRKAILDDLFLRPIMEESVPIPEIYVLTRKMNTGYAGYDSDTSIVISCMSCRESAAPSPATGPPTSICLLRSITSRPPMTSAG